MNGLIYPGLFLTVWSLPFTAWWSAETVSGFATRKGTHSFPFLQMYLELKLSIEKVRAKKATTENANYSLFWQVGVKKNKLRVVETGIEILQKGFSLCVHASNWLDYFFFSFFLPCISCSFPQLNIASYGHFLNTIPVVNTTTANLRQKESCMQSETAVPSHPHCCSSSIKQLIFIQIVKKGRKMDLKWMLLCWMM